MARFDLFNKARTNPLGVVFVVGDQGRSDVVGGEQLARDAGVFAGDDVGCPKRLAGPPGHVAEVADRGRDDFKRGGRFTKPFGPATFAFGPFGSGRLRRGTE